MKQADTCSSGGASLGAIAFHRARWAAAIGVFVTGAVMLFASPSSQASEPLGVRIPGGKQLVCDRLIDDFSGSRVGSFPSGWGTRESREKQLAERHQMYRVEQDGAGKVLRARYADTAVTIGRPIDDWNLDEYPVLQWKWKALQLPAGGNETNSGTNDCAAAVYSIWQVGFPFHVDGIKYSWSSTLPAGTRHSKRLGHDHVLVVDSGNTHAGKWRTVRVDVREEHARFFERSLPRRPHGIAILTDADATESTAEALYADFRLCRFE